MESDMKYGRFDEEGTFLFNRLLRKRRGGPDADGNESESEDSVGDPWLESIREEKESRSTLEKRAHRHMQVRNQKFMQMVHSTMVQSQQVSFSGAFFKFFCLFL